MRLIPAIITVFVLYTPTAAQTISDVYLACRHRDITTASSTDSIAQATRRFCEIRLPRRNAFMNPTDAWRAHNALPTSGTIMTYAQAVRRQLEDHVTPSLSSGTVSSLDTIFEPILFKADSTTVGAGYSSALDTMAERMKAILAVVPAHTFVVYGSADSFGRSAARNDQLAWGRANALAQELHMRGVPLRSMIVQYAVQQVDRSSAFASRKSTVLASTTALLTTQNTATPPSGGATPKRETTILAAATDALLDRAFEQVEVYLLATVADSLCSGPFRTVIEQTCAFFGTERRHQLYPGVAQLRAALSQDFKVLPFSMSVDLLDSNLEAFVPELRIEIALVRHLLKYVERVRRGYEPVEALSAIDSLPDVLKRAEIVIRYLELFDSVRPPVAQVVADGTLVDTLALYSLKSFALAQKAPHDAALWRGPLLPHADTLYDAAIQLMEYYTQLEALLPRITGGSRNEALTAAGALVLEAMEVAQAAFQPAVGGVKPDTVRLMLRAVADLVAQTTQGEYRSATQSFMQLVRQLEIDSFIVADSHCSFQDSTKVNLCRYGSRVASGIRVLMLAGEVLEADDQLTIRAAFRSFLQQGTGFMAKRELAGWHWSINAYVGAGGGLELVRNRGLGSLGLSLPVGIEASRPTGRGSSRGWFFQLLDLGSIASVRVAGDAETLPTQTFSNVLAFGVSHLWGWRNRPFATRLGIDWLPNYRRLDVESPARSALRLNAGVHVDIPIFP